ncbi:hypothetical protein Avbf_10317 [Armadillidium vulgare]|nr:hypothetical protein Avbf_10317 [Armadillidium vulgare]
MQIIRFNNFQIYLDIIDIIIRMTYKVLNLILILTTSLSLCERECTSDNELETEETSQFCTPLSTVKDKKVSDALNYQDLLTLITKQRESEPEEYKKMNTLLKPTLLIRRNISLKDLISVLVEIFYRKLGYKEKLHLDINNAVVDNNLREDYRNFIKLLEEEVLDYIVPVNFLEIIFRKEELQRIACSSYINSDYVDKMKTIDIYEAFNFIMTLPKLYSKKMGYPLENFIHLMETLIIKPEKNSRRLVEEDIDNETFPKKSWSVLLKTILSEVPVDLRKEIFDYKWKSEINVKVLDLFKNLSYNINLFTFSIFDGCEDNFFKEFSRCPRCQRIVLESILKSIEKFLGDLLQGKYVPKDL